jgi:hypothetical protein
MSAVLVKYPAAGVYPCCHNLHVTFLVMLHMGVGLLVDNFSGRFDRNGTRACSMLLPTPTGRIAGYFASTVLMY